jgi:hypothetical protein
MKEFRKIEQNKYELEDFKSFKIPINEKINFLGELVEYNKLKEKLNDEKLKIQFPNISNYKRRLQSIPVSNYVVERSHSMRKLVQQKRMNLHVKKLNEILFIKYNK